MEFLDYRIPAERVWYMYLPYPLLDFCPPLQVGIALKPSTPVEAALPHASSVEMILVMTREPGVKGQDSMSSNALHKVETLRQKYPDLLVKTDGWEQPTMERVSSMKQGFLWKLFQGWGAAA